jgi:protein-tyrosine phosphatase
MIDIHTHILPYCDDGAETMEDSIKELSAISDSGVTDAILTPHYIRNVFENTRDNIQPIFNDLRLKLIEQDIHIRIHLGNEIYLDEKTLEDLEEFELSLAGTNYILVETGFNGFPPNFLEILFQLVRKGYKPVLAHPERYADIMNNHNMAEDLIYRNIYLQMNAGSFLGYYGNTVQKTAWQLLKRKLVHFLASDTHCNMDYYFLNEALQTVAKHTDKDFLNKLTQENPQRLLDNLNIDYLNN